MSRPASVAALLAPFDQEGVGIFLKERQAGEVIELNTADGKTFMMFIGDPEKGEVALKSSSPLDFEGRSAWFVLQGSTAGGSVTKIDWIGIGLRPRFNSLTGPGLALLSPVLSVRWLRGEEAEAIRAEAETTRPREATPKEKEEREAIFRNWLDSLQWGKHSERVKKLLGEFCFPNGQVHIATILDLAHKAGKLLQGLEVIDRHMVDHWSWMPPPFRGDIITEKDAYYLKLAYKEIGISLPNQEPE